jgi:hypothetical protein
MSSREFRFGLVEAGTWVFGPFRAVGKGGVRGPRWRNFSWGQEVSGSAIIRLPNRGEGAGE